MGRSCIIVAPPCDGSDRGCEQIGSDAGPEAGAGCGGRWFAAVSIALPCALAADSTSLGTFKRWTALSFPDEGGVSCMMWSQPEKVRVSMEDRGDAFVFVTHRSSPRQFDAVTLDNGYPFREGTQVNVSIDDRDFVLATSGSSAWTLDGADDAKMVRRCAPGYSMTVEGTSASGKRTSDVYSLLGFTAAHEAIDEACGRG